MTLPFLLSLLGLAAVGTGCQETSSSQTTRVPAPVQVVPPDTVPAKRPADGYERLLYSKTEHLSAAPGTKSVLFNTSGSQLYAMNLEGMSVYEFDQASRTLTREFKFRPTRGTGWDYVREKPIPSFQEKPVEACMSHDDRILWVSLHNAGGIVPIWVDDLSHNRARPDTSRQAVKNITVVYPGTGKTDSFTVPLIATGKTPKVIAKTADSHNLLVSNWHSYNVSVLETDTSRYPYAAVSATIPVSSIPRGMAVDDKDGRSYIAIMGGASLAVVDNQSWIKQPDMPVASNPRHVVMDTSGHLFVSYNKLAKVACIEAATGKTLFTGATHAQPRTIVLSKNHKFLFVTCYSSDYVDVYRIHADRFEKIGSFPCKGHPVGVDIFEDEQKLEAWVCSYTTGSISIFSFRKMAE